MESAEAWVDEFATSGPEFHEAKAAVEVRVESVGGVVTSRFKSGNILENRGLKIEIEEEEKLARTFIVYQGALDKVT